MDRVTVPARALLFAEGYCEVPVQKLRRFAHVEGSLPGRLEADLYKPTLTAAGGGSVSSTDSGLQQKRNQLR